MNLRKDHWHPTNFKKKLQLCILFFCCNPLELTPAAWAIKQALYACGETTPLRCLSFLCFFSFHLLTQTTITGRMIWSQKKEIHYDTALISGWVQCMMYCPLFVKEKLSIITFQRWIPWLPQRWRTPRNAICNVNCRIKWIIKSLNANCAWSSPPSIPGSASTYIQKKSMRHAHSANYYYDSSQPTLLAHPQDGIVLAGNVCICMRSCACVWRRLSFKKKMGVAFLHLHLSESRE